MVSFDGYSSNSVSRCKNFNVLQKKYNLEIDFILTNRPITKLYLEMKPKEFLRLAMTHHNKLEGDRDILTIDYLKGCIQESVIRQDYKGNIVKSTISDKISIPYLNIETKAYDKITVTGHDGRHRAKAFEELGYSKMPVMVQVCLNSKSDWCYPDKSICEPELNKVFKALKNGTVKTQDQKREEDRTAQRAYHSNLRKENKDRDSQYVSIELNSRGRWVAPSDKTTSEWSAKRSKK